MVRRLLRTMVDDVEAGRDPLGVSRVDGPPRRVESGVFSLSADSGVLLPGGTAAKMATTAGSAAGA